MRNDEASFSKLSNEREKKEIDRDEKTTKKFQNGIFGESNNLKHSREPREEKVESYRRLPRT